MSIGVMRLEKRGSMAVSLSDVISASETGSNHCPWQTRSEANPDPYEPSGPTASRLAEGEVTYELVLASVSSRALSSWSR